MEQFARTIGLLSSVAGVILLASPETARQLIKARAEFAHLSPAALRFLGGWYLLTGGLLVSVTTRPAVETREVIRPELRKAA